jgi:hypothetical protein
MQAGKLSALGKQFQSAFERGHAQYGLTRKHAGTSGLQMKDGRARSTSSVSRCRDSFKEFAGASIFAFVIGKICLLQNRWDFLRKRFTDITAEHAAH